jgi:hypothetical protein
MVPCSSLPFSIDLRSRPADKDGTAIPNKFSNTTRDDKSLSLGDFETENQAIGQFQLNFCD